MRAQPQLLTQETARFLDAAKAGNLDVLTSMLENGVDINTKDPRGIPSNRTALMHAAESGHLRTIDLLLNRGANLEAKDKGLGLDAPGGNTALLLAVRNDHQEIAERLLAGGANPNAKGGGTIALCYAARHEQSDLVQKLLAFGADPNLASSLDGTPLTSATWASNLALVRLLLNAGAKVDSRDTGRETSLNIAVMHGRMDICEELLKSYADPNCPSGWHNATALMRAVVFNHPEILRLLLKAHARLDLKNKKGETAMEIALHRSNTNCIAILKEAGAKT